MSFFHPFENKKIKENSAKAVYEQFAGHYNIKEVEQTGENTYTVKTRDGSRMKVKVCETTNIFGEKHSVIRSVDEDSWFRFKL